MSDQKVVLIASLLLLLTAVFAPATPADKSIVVGTWKGKMYGVPAVTLIMKEEGGKLSGSILFFLIRHNDGQPPRPSPGTFEPLIDPQFDGKVLFFKVSHRNAHPPRTLNDPPVSFRFELIDNRRAILVREGEEEDSRAELLKQL